MCSSIPDTESPIEDMHIPFDLFRLSLLVIYDAIFNLSCLFGALRYTRVIIFMFPSLTLLLSLSYLPNSTPLFIYLIPHHIVAVKYCNYKQTQSSTTTTHITFGTIACRSEQSGQ